VKKYRIIETATGHWRIGVLASKTGEELWVPAASDQFVSRQEAEQALGRVIRAAKYYYDETGAPLHEER
jgi:hypothetical protein